MNHLALLEGLLRSGVWMIGAFVSFKAKTWLSLVGCLMAVMLGFANTLIIAGAWSPSPVAVDFLVALGGVTGALLVAAIIAHRKPGVTWSR